MRQLNNRETGGIIRGKLNDNFNDIENAFFEMQKITWARKVPEIADIKNAFGSKILSFLPLNETSGTTLSDVSGNGNDASINGTVTLGVSTEVVNADKCVDFLGTGYIDLASINSSIDMEEGFFSMNLKFDDTATIESDNKYICRIEADSNNKIYAETTRNAINFYHRANGVSNFISVPVPRDTGWCNIGFGWSVSEARLKGYFNGQLTIDESFTFETFTGSVIATRFFSAGYAGSYLDTKAFNLIVLNSLPTEDEVKNSVQIFEKIIFEGDSRTDQRHFVTLAIKNSSANVISSGRKAIANKAVGGSTITDVTSRLQQAIDTAVVGKNYLTVWMGTNSYGLSAQQLFDGIKQYCTDAKNSGRFNKVILCTEIDSTEPNRVANGWRTKYIELNNLIKADNSFYDILVDLGAQTELQDGDNTTYFSDTLHLTTAGYEVVGNAINAALISAGII